MNRPPRDPRPTFREAGDPTPSRPTNPATTEPPTPRQNDATAWRWVRRAPVFGLRFVAVRPDAVLAVAWCSTRGRLRVTSRTLRLKLVQLSCLNLGSQPLAPARFWPRLRAGSSSVPLALFPVCRFAKGILVFGPM